MAYDSAHGVALLFGGRDGTGQVFGDTWQYGPALPGGFDGDGDMDLDDYVTFAGCMAGPGGLPPECTTADFDNDNDCDLDDFAALQDAFTG